MYLSRLTVRGFRASAEAEIEAHLPGRFSVLVGANGAGKTTVADAMYLGHQSRFPYLPAMNAAALGVGGRELAVEYSYELKLESEGALGRRLQIESSVTDPGGVAAYWTRSLERRMGSIRAVDQVTHPASERVKLLYLPAWRNPLDELARREARILVELLRAQQQRLTGSRNLTSLRVRAYHLLEQLTTGGLIGAVEDRVEEHLSALSAGVRRQWGYVGGQVVDDAYLARVLELMLAALEGRANAQPLEVSGLGYVNLLHIAVTLAAVPDLEANAKDGPQTSPRKRAQA